MSFKVEGTIDVTVMEAYVQECRFQPEVNEVNNRGEQVFCWYDLALLVQDAQGNNDTWCGEVSTRTGKGNFADKYRFELTLQTLQDIGFNVTTLQELEAQFQPTEDRSICIPNIIGLKCKAVTCNRTFKKRDGSEGQAIQIKYLAGLDSGAGGRRLNFDEFMRARQAQAAQGYAQAATAPAPAPVQAAPAPVQASAPAPAAAPAPAPAAPAPGYPQGYAQPAPAYQQPAAAPAPGAPVPPPAPAPGAPATPKCPY